MFDFLGFTSSTFMLLDDVYLFNTHGNGRHRAEGPIPWEASYLGGWLGTVMLHRQPMGLKCLMRYTWVIAAGIKHSHGVRECSGWLGNGFSTRRN